MVVCTYLHLMLLLRWTCVPVFPESCAAWRAVQPFPRDAGDAHAHTGASSANAFPVTVLAPGSHGMPTHKIKIKLNKKY